MKLLKLWLIVILLSGRADAQTCIKCPGDAGEVAIGSGFRVYVHRNGADKYVNGELVGACENLVLRAEVYYMATASSGAIGAGFIGGKAHIILPDNTAVDTTPADMQTTLIGPAPCATTPFKKMNELIYQATAADISAGAALWTFQFTNWTALLPNAQNHCPVGYSFAFQQAVLIAPPPIAAIAPATNWTCIGSSPTFTVDATGTGPLSYSWSGPNGFNSTNTSITITNVQTTNVGLYTAVVADQFGCITNAIGVLLLVPKFTGVTMTGSDLILSGCGGGSNGVYTVVTATNASIPTALWTSLMTNNFDALGQFNFTVPVNVNNGERYFRILIP